MKFEKFGLGEPGIVYMPYIIKEDISEEYFKNQKILKVKDWLRIQKFTKKSVNKNFYSTITLPDISNIPEIELKMETKKVEGGTLKRFVPEWKAVSGIEKGQLSELTEDEFAFNKISKELKKIGL